MLDERADVDLGEQPVDVYLAEQGIDVDLFRDRGEVEFAQQGVHVDPLDQFVHVQGVDDQVDDLVIICGVFIHPDAEDNAKIKKFNYEATKLSIERAMK